VLWSQLHRHAIASDDLSLRSVLPDLGRGVQRLQPPVWVVADVEKQEGPERVVVLIRDFQAELFI
jgi:hypothetical protein